MSSNELRDGGEYSVGGSSDNGSDCTSDGRVRGDGSTYTGVVDAVVHTDPPAITGAADGGTGARGAVNISSLVKQITPRRGLDNIDGGQRMIVVVVKKIAQQRLDIGFGSPIHRHRAP